MNLNNINNKFQVIVDEEKRLLLAAKQLRRMPKNITQYWYKSLLLEVDILKMHNQTKDILTLQ
jgi:hypothetical protein